MAETMDPLRVGADGAEAWLLGRSPGGKRRDGAWKKEGGGARIENRKSGEKRQQGDLSLSGESLLWPVSTAQPPAVDY